MKYADQIMVAMKIFMLRNEKKNDERAENGEDR